MAARLADRRRARMGRLARRAARRQRAAAALLRADGQPAAGAGARASTGGLSRGAARRGSDLDRLGGAPAETANGPTVHPSRTRRRTRQGRRPRSIRPFRCRRRRGRTAAAAEPSRARAGACRGGACRRGRRGDGGFAAAGRARTAPSSCRRCTTSRSRAPQQRPRSTASTRLRSRRSSVGSAAATPPSRCPSSRYRPARTAFSPASRTAATRQDAKS